MKERRSDRSLPAVSAVLLALLGGTPLAAQDDPVEDPKFQSGLMPQATYAGPHVKMNLENGGLNLSIPLFNLPGRAGLDLSAVLSYSSKQLAAEYNGSLWTARWQHEGPTVGRWILNLWPSLQEEVPGSLYYFTTPSGAVHKLHRLEGGDLYASDSTNIRFNSVTKKVEFLGGLTYDFSQYDSQMLVHERDRNGNQITYRFETVNGFERPYQVTDTLGRQALLAYDDEVGGSNPRLLRQISVQNHAGADLVYSFDYLQRFLVPTVYTGTNPPYRWYGVDAAEVSGWQYLLSQVTLPNGLTWRMDYWRDQVPGRPDPEDTAALSRLTLPTGAVVDIQYVGPDDSNVKAGHWRLSKMVSRIDTDPVGGGAFSTAYGYAWDTVNWYPTKTTETRADGSKHAVDWNPQGDPFQHLRQKESWTDTDGTTALREAETGWIGAESGNSVSSLLIRDPASGWEARTTRVLDGWGREASRTVYNQYETLPGVYQFRLLRGVSRRWNDVGADYLSLLLQEDVIDYLNNAEERVVASTRFEYDQHPLTDRGVVTGQAPGYGPSNQSRGNLTAARRHLFSESRFLESFAYYDTVGNAVQTVDPEGHSSTVDYSAAFHYAYPTSAVNALGHTTQSQYDFETGLALSTTDANGQTVTFSYDAYNRVLQENYPDGGWTQHYYKDDYFNGKLRSYMRTRRRVSGTLYDQRYDFFDGLGRLLRTTRTAPTGEAAIRVDREYAACSCTGRTARVSLPFRQGQESPVWTETRWDGIGRVVKVIPPDGAASANHTEYRYGTTQIGGYAYQVRAVFDAKGVGRALVYDAGGQLVQVREDADYATLNSSTKTDYDQRPDAAYSWALHQRYNPSQDAYVDVFVRLTPYNWSEIQQGVQTRSVRRDSLARAVEETHPENGVTMYGYYDDGSLLTRTDARGVVTTIGYDSLHRPLTIDYSDATPPAGYVYDQGSYGVGRLHEASNANAVSTFTYDLMGRVAAQNQVIDGLSFSMSWSYNYLGQPAAATLPDGTTIANSYDRMGRLTQVDSDRVDATHPAVLASNFVYHAGGGALSVDWGNGTVTQRTLNESHQLKTLRHGPAAAPGQHLDLEYDYEEGVANTGQIMSIVDRNDPTKTVNYTYDDFRRLKTAETQGTHWGLSWSYDRYGNRLTQSLTKGTAPTNTLSVNGADNRVNGWSYDAAGNVLNDGDHAYAYDANNMITSVDGGAVQYKYDSGGRRVMKVAGSETLYYVFGAEYSSAAGWKRVFVVAAGMRIEYRDGQTYFHQIDHLGTPRVQTDSAGSLVESWSYYPFGEQWEQAGSGGNEHRFTGHRRDPETGNDYAGARYLKGSSGRWTSVDPQLGDLSNPQRLNRYSYVQGDAANLVDPDGAEGEKPCLNRGPDDKKCPPKPRGPDEWAPPNPRQPRVDPGIVNLWGPRPLPNGPVTINQEKESFGLPQEEGRRKAVERWRRFTDALAKAHDKATDVKNKNCNSFLESILKWASSNGPAPQNATLGNLLDAMTRATYAFGDDSHSALGTVTTLSSGESVETTAVTVGGNVYLGDRFFSSGHNRVATLLHEAFHVIFNRGDEIVGLALSDRELAIAAGVFKEGFSNADSAAAFTNELKKHCK